MAIAHFAVGAALTTLLVAFVLPTIQYQRSMTLFGGGWALLPDLHWISPIAATEIHHFHRVSPWVDLFWFHRFLDYIDPTNDRTTAAICLVLLCIATVVADWQSQRVIPPDDMHFEDHVPDVSAIEQK